MAELLETLSLQDERKSVMKMPAFWCLTFLFVVHMCYASFQCFWYCKITKDKVVRISKMVLYSYIQKGSTT